jgi:hypothetical protein
MRLIDSIKISRKLISKSPLEVQGGEAKDWARKSPSQRLAGLEFLRQLNYEYDPLSSRLQRFYTVVKRPAR